MRVLIIPMYVVWLPFMMLNAALMGPGGTPSALAPLIWGLGLVAGLAPYALVDWIFARSLRSISRRDTRA